MMRKGAERHAVEQAAKDLYGAGYGHFIFESDGERALKALNRVGVNRYREIMVASDHRSGSQGRPRPVIFRTVPFSLHARWARRASVGQRA